MDYGNYTNNKYWVIADILSQNINKKTAATLIILFIQFLIWVSLICCTLPADSLLSRPGEYYLAYIRHDDSAAINLTLGSYKYKIYNPQTGDYCAEQMITNWDGGNKRFSKPSGEDWVVYVYKDKN